MLSSDFLFPRFLVLVVPPANPSNFSHSKCFSSWIYIGLHIISMDVKTACSLCVYIHYYFAYN